MVISKGFRVKDIYFFCISKSMEQKQKSYEEMNFQERQAYWKQEDLKDATIRKVLTVQRKKDHLDECRGVTQLNAEKQFKNLMLGEFMLGSNDVYFLEADYFLGKGKKAVYTIKTDYRDYSNAGILELDMGDVREELNAHIKAQREQHEYFDVVKSLPVLFDLFYTKLVKRLREE